jgi:hypothetical protein
MTTMDTATPAAEVISKPASEFELLGGGLDEVHTSNTINSQPNNALTPNLSNSLTDLAARIRAEHEATAASLKRGAEHAMAAGKLLIEAKAQLKHGEWLPWLRDLLRRVEDDARTERVLP